MTMTPTWLIPSILSGGIAYIVYSIMTKTEQIIDHQHKGESLILEHTVDFYNGVRIKEYLLPTDKPKFELRLKYSVHKWRENGHRGCWLKLEKQLFVHLEFCVSLGFNIHHSQPEYIMLQIWLPLNEKSMIPQYAFSYMGAHAFILNNKNQLVVMREHYGNNIWKIPGGAVDFGEQATNAVIREAKEETGLDCEFLGVLCVRHILNFRFGNTSDLSFLCLLKAKNINQKLDPIHLNEVLDVKWMDIDQFIKFEKHVFLGDEKENLDLLKNAANWIAKYWNDTNCEEAKLNSPCIHKFKQTHPFDAEKKFEIALYHRYS